MQPLKSFTSSITRTFTPKFPAQSRQFSSKTSQKSYDEFKKFLQATALASATSVGTVTGMKKLGILPNPKK